MKKLILSVLLLFSSSMMFAEIAIQFVVPCLGLSIVTEKNEYSRENSPSGIFTIPTPSILSNTGISVDYEFPTDDSWRWFAGGNLIYSRWGLAAGLEGGANHELFQTKHYLWDLNTKFKAALIFNGPFYMVQPEVHFVLMDPSKKGLNFVMGAIFYNMALFYKNEQNQLCYKVLNNISTDIGFGYRF